MKILLYCELEKLYSKSGIGRALRHQIKALETAGIEYTTDPNDDFDILHINTYMFNSKFLLNKVKKTNKPIIFHAHSTEEDFRNSFIFSNQLSPIFKKHLIKMYSEADELITPTPYSKSILESYGLKQKINVISNGIDLNRFAYSEEKKRAFYNYFSLKKEDKIIMSVGLLFKRKGILDFFEIAKHFPNYKFIWFGSINHLTLTNEIKKAIANKPDNVIMPGYVKGAIIEGAYLAADLFVFPSYEETEGIVVLEALASRIPVILRNIPVYKPWLKHGENVYFANDNNEFIKYIDDFYNDQLIDLTDAAYKVALERSIEKIGIKLKEIYTRLYENRK